MDRLSIGLLLASISLHGIEEKEVGWGGERDV
jgi:hypothetical protein